jgi:Fe-S cluster assembly iron-binding protein IscA
MVTCDDVTLKAVREALSRLGSTGPVRIELCFTGCCDPSLGLRVDAAAGTDLVEDMGDVRFVMGRETGDLVGDVTITYVHDRVRKGFVVTSSRPLGEWDGFSACEIRDTPAGRQG